MGVNGLKAHGTRMKIGIIDTGFRGFTAAANSGRLPAPPSASGYNSSRVKTQCRVHIGTTSAAAPFRGCEAINTNMYDDVAKNNAYHEHGTNVAEVIMDLVPEAELYIANMSIFGNYDPVEGRIFEGYRPV